MLCESSEFSAYMFSLLCESGRSAKVVVLQSSVLRRVGMYGHIHIILKDSKSNVCWTAVYCLLSTPNLGYVDICSTILPDMDRLTGVSCESILCFRKASVFRPTLLSSQFFQQDLITSSFGLEKWAQILKLSGLEEDQILEPVQQPDDVPRQKRFSIICFHVQGVLRSCSLEIRMRNCHEFS